MSEIETPDAKWLRITTGQDKLWQQRKEELQKRLSGCLGDPVSTKRLREEWDRARKWYRDAILGAWEEHAKTLNPEDEGTKWVTPNEVNKLREEEQQLARREAEQSEKDDDK